MFLHCLYLTTARIRAFNSLFFILQGDGDEDAMTKERRVWSRLLVMGLCLTIPAVLVQMVIPMVFMDTEVRVGGGSSSCCS